MTALPLCVAVLLLLSLVSTSSGGRACDPSSRFRTFDGTCNNEAHPRRGAVGQPIRLPSRMGPFVNATFTERPSARAVSNVLMSGPWSPPSRRVTDLFTFFAQFLDHDIIRFAKPSKHAPQLPIGVPRNDDVFTDRALPFARLSRARGPPWLGAKRAPANLLSSYIDASAVYGTSPSALRALRAPRDGCRLATGRRNTLPDGRGGFRAGDSRVNENVLLIALHTLFVREHNTLCAELEAAFPRWSHWRRFQTARKIVGAELQSITYDQFLPAILGSAAPRGYASYNASEDPRPSLLFAGAAFRVGHVLINENIVSRRAHGAGEQHIPVAHTLFAPAEFRRLGLDALLRGAVSTRAKALNMHVVHGLRNLLITAADGRRLDLASINIQRGRDLQVPLYNDARRQHGLRPATWFTDISRDMRVVRKLRSLYRNVERVDAWVGGLAESPSADSAMGPLFTRIWADDFRRMRDADRFFYQRPGAFESEIVVKMPILKIVLSSRRRDVMKQVILRNTKLTSHQVPDNPFIPVGA